jgi:mannose-6-phosphate isomerase-like protein (cupin superfamily)
MRIVKRKDSKEIKNSETCIATEYPIDDKDINIALVKILKDRYPQEGWAVNEVCKEMVFITKGSATITTEEGSVDLRKGDVVLVEPGEKYYWEGNFEMIVPCSPAWYVGQHKILK